MTQDFDLSKLLPSIQIHPFPSIQEFNRIGEKLVRGLNRGELLHHREAIIECPTCLALDDFYSREKTRKFESFYCAGNQPAEVEHIGIFGDKHKHEIVCAGVPIAHFHVSCGCCGKQFLLSIPDQK